MKHIPHTITAPPREQLLRAWPEVFPGIDRIVVLFRLSDSELAGQELVAQGNGYRLRELLLQGFEDRLAPLLAENQGYGWVSSEQLPFETSSYKSGQLEIFSEQSHVVLTLRLKSSEKGDSDLFYLFFREDQSNFGVSRLQGTLDTARKALIGALVFRFARYYYRSAQDVNQYIAEFTDITRELITARPAPPVVDNALISWIAQWANAELKQLQTNNPFTFRLSPEALQKLSLAGNFETARSTLHKAARFAMMLYAGYQGDEVVLEPAFFVFEANTKNEIQSVESTNRQSKLSRTRQLLDRLEAAAIALNQRGEDITSFAVGQALERPVTAPAITDALRKNKRRICALLEQNPAQWPLIRRQFRPLTNLIDKEMQLRQIS